MAQESGDWLRRETALARRSKESQATRRIVISDRPWEARSSPSGESISRTSEARASRTVARRIEGRPTSGPSS